MIKLDPGQVIRFTYHHPPEGVDEATGDRYKEVLILHPSWHHKIHGIDLKRLTQAEREVLHAILDEKEVQAAKAGKRHKFPLVNDIIRRMDPLQEIKNPVSFYVRFGKVFLRNKDAYRTYEPVRMSSVTIVQKTDVRGKQINPNPLFHKVESKPQQPEKPAQPKQPAGPAKPLSRLELIRQRALNKK